jgi:hypothetical protein
VLSREGSCPGEGSYERSEGSGSVVSWLVSSKTIIFPVYRNTTAKLDVAARHKMHR